MKFHLKCILVALATGSVGCDREDSPTVDRISRGTNAQGDGIKADTCAAALTEGTDATEIELTTDAEEWAPYVDGPNSELSLGAENLALLAEPVTYDGQIAKLLGQFCVNCHKPGGDRPDLSTYTLAKQNGPSSLSSINRNRMPTRTPLAQSDKDLFKAWSDAGFPQNMPAPPPAPAPAPTPTSSPDPSKVPPAAPIVSSPPPLSPSPKEESVTKPSVQKAASVNCKR